MLQIYRRFWQVNWAERWQYRANLMMYLLYWLVSPVVYLAVWTSIANAKGDVNGLTANDFVVYYLAVLIVEQFTSEITIHILAYKIQDGTLAGELIKPVHPVLTNTLVNNIASKLLFFLVLMPVWFVLVILFRPDFSAITLASALWAIPAILLGFTINFFFGAVITCLAFWTTRIYSLSEFFGAVRLLFSGQFAPLTLMPFVIQQIAEVLPFQFLIYLPIQILQGKLPQAEILSKYGLGLLWLLFFYLLFRWVWREGLKRFSAVGA